VYHRFSIPDGGGTVRETTIDRLYFDAETGLMQTVTPTLTGVLYSFRWICTLFQ
jgi:large repetitive protein